MPLYPRQNGLPRPYNLQYSKKSSFSKYLNTPMKKYLAYFIILSTMGLLVYTITSISRIKESDISVNLDHDRIQKQKLQLKQKTQLKNEQIIDNTESQITNQVIQSIQPDSKISKIIKEIENDNSKLEIGKSIANKANHLL
ncbi:hypothetical protein WICMUC_005424 [Wickerhamomyces mucosus]|uniref:Uncharacterized protein n=1 Tax=Wickerhamomyces mucosus TaxID=1378264 RepID=A0A9P8P948_9ASCO|nr:hypothetical protein WICMUC_005424 [Wickerhamomyces mucosus]